MAANYFLTSVGESFADPWNYSTEIPYENFSLEGLSENLKQFTVAAQETSENDTFFHCPYSGQNQIGNLISMVLYTIVCCIGLFGNSLVIYVVLRFSKMKTVTNIYILNLAIADECFLIGIPFLITTMNVGEWIFGNFLCKAYMVSTSITQFTSSIFLLIMSADRFIAVCHPISSPRFRTTFVSKIVSGVAWTIAGIIMMPIALYSQAIEMGGQYSCNIIWPPNDGNSSNFNIFDSIYNGLNGNDGTTFIVYSLTLGFAIPLSLILIFYYLVLRKLRNVGPKNKSKEKKRSHRKVTKLVLTVITVYILCWLPYWISQLALINSPPDSCKSKLEVTIFVLVGCLGYSNSAMNPILYAFLSDNFKKSFLKACTCAKGKDINAQLQVENSFFPKFGKSRGSERLSSKAPAASQIATTNIHVSKIGCTVDSIVECGNGHGNPNKSYVNNKGHVNNNCHNEEEDDEDEISQKKTNNTISIINSDIAESSNSLASKPLIQKPLQPRPPVLHTDL